MWHQIDQKQKGDCFLLVYMLSSVFFHWLLKNMLIHFFSDWLSGTEYLETDQGGKKSVNLAKARWPVTNAVSLNSMIMVINSYYHFLNNHSVHSTLLLAPETLSYNQVRPFHRWRNWGPKKLSNSCPQALKSGGEWLSHGLIWKNAVFLNTTLHCLYRPGSSPSRLERGRFLKYWHIKPSARDG